MKLRELPGALVLGLLAALAAHGGLYGGGHAAGGAYHGLLASLALAGGAGLGMAAALAAWLGRGEYAEGSILARRLSLLLPGVSALSGCAFAWYTLAEAIEGNHGGVPLALAIGALFVTCALMLLSLRAVLRLLAAIAVRMVHVPHAVRPVRWIRRLWRTVVIPPAPQRTQRFARPPPVAMIRG